MSWKSWTSSHEAAQGDLMCHYSVPNKRLFCEASPLLSGGFPYILLSVELSIERCFPMKTNTVCGPISPAALVSSSCLAFRKSLRKEKWSCQTFFHARELRFLFLHARALRPFATWEWQAAIGALVFSHGPSSWFGTHLWQTCGYLAAGDQH